MDVAKLNVHFTHAFQHPEYREKSVYTPFSEKEDTKQT